MRYLILIAMLFTGCATGPQLYVKEGEQVTKVKVKECVKAKFRNIDTKEVVTRDFCSDLTLTPAQWKKAMQNVNASITGSEESDE